MSKKKCKCGKKKKDCKGKCEFAPVFYYAGDGSKGDRKFLCEMAMKGIRVYALMGKPGCPNPNGCT